MNVVIDKMLTIDETGMPQAPTLRQILDKDVALLWQRDTTKDKRKYIAEAGVIYYLGDPKSLLFVNLLISIILKILQKPV